jgi:hypothetical protein
MDDNEVNKIICKFMECEYTTWRVEGDKIIMYPDGPHYVEYNLFTESLDALVPVWGKLKKVNFFFGWCKDEWEFILTEVNKIKDHGYEGIRELGNIQQAAAHVTAKAILELNKE